MFTKKDLKDGMIVKNGYGNFYLVLKDNFIGEDGWEVILNFNYNLEHITNEGENIEKVWQIEDGNIGYVIYGFDLSKVEETSCAKLVFDRKNEIDWSKVEVDTKVLVRESEKLEWEKRHFSHYCDNTMYCFCNGCTSFSGKNTSSWTYAKLYK